MDSFTPTGEPVRGPRLLFQEARKDGQKRLCQDHVILTGESFEARAGNRLRESVRDAVDGGGGSSPPQRSATVR